MSRDAEDAALDAQVAASRRLGASERFRIGAEMSEDARRISIEGERRRHPELPEGEARLRVLRRLWGDELASRVPARRSMSPDEYYVDAETARDAFGRRSMFNVVDHASGWKVDLIVRKNPAFSREEFSRETPL